MSDDGSGIRRVAGFDPAEEVEEGSGILRNAVIRPGCELELAHLPPLAAAALRGKKNGQMVCTQRCASLLRDGTLQHKNNFYQAFKRHRRVGKCVCVWSPGYIYINNDSASSLVPVKQAAAQLFFQSQRSSQSPPSTPPPLFTGIAEHFMRIILDSGTHLPT